jgi:branched-chain amino acid transport system permease protein
MPSRSYCSPHCGRWAWCSSGVNPYILQILIYIGINVILAVSLNPHQRHRRSVLPRTRRFSAIGAYVSAALHDVRLAPGPVPIALALALLAGGLAAAVADSRSAFRRCACAATTSPSPRWAWGVIRVVILNTETVGGARECPAFPCWPASSRLCLHAGVRRRHLAPAYLTKGSAFFAIREGRDRRGGIDIDTTRYKTIAFIVGSFWAGLAGGLFAHFIGYIHTNSFTFLKSIEVVVMVVLGGMGSISGAIFAAAVLTVLPELLRFGAEYRMIIYSVLLIVLMITRPTGLLGNREITQWRSSKPRTVP